MENNLVEELQKARALVVTLAREIDFKNQKLLEMEKKYDEISTTLSVTTMKNARLQQANVEGMKQMRFVDANNRKLQNKLESQRNDYEQKIAHLEKQLEFELRNLLIEKEELLRLKVESSTEKGYAFASEAAALKKQLAEKVEELQSMDQLYQTLILKQHTSNSELQNARKELINEVVDKDDRKLKELRSMWGKAAYKAIVDALMELNEYNPSGRYIVPELWSFKEGRKARL